jgi:DNA polymerase-3 subunit delta
MKIQSYKSDDFIKSIGTKNDLKGVLLYGPEAGLISVRSKEIQKNLSKNSNTEYIAEKIYESQTKDNPSIIFDEFVSISMFGDKKILVLKEFSDAVYKTLEELVDKPSDHFIIIESDNLDTKSKLRQFAEKNDYFAAIPCYVDDEKGIKSIIMQKFNSLGLKYDKEVLDLLTSNFGGNRMIMMNEVEKLIIFVGEDKHITINHFKECIQDVSEAEIDDLINNFADLEPQKTYKILQKLFNENVNFTVILRSLINYFSKLQLVKTLVDRGENYENAVSELKPPLFFKQAPIFARHVQKWKLKNINLLLDRLNTVELRCKSIKMDTNLIISEFINTSIIYFSKANK